MLAARDQENLVYSHQAGGVAKQQGTRHLMPKTPAPHGGKSVIGGRNMGQENAMTAMKGGKNTVLGTPLETRPRAVLGNKTTNAKAKTGQPLRVKDAVNQIDKNQTKHSSSRRHKLKPSLSDNPKTESVGLKLAQAEDIETAPKRVPDLPYESDIFPRGGLTFEGLKPENMFKGYYRHYYDPVDENGVSLREQRFKQQMKTAMEKGERKIEQEAENLDWSVPGAPTTAAAKTKPAARAQRRAPSATASRTAAAALSMTTTNSTFRQPRVPKQSIQIQRPSRIDSAMSVAVSRTTLGYTRGRAMANKTKVMHADVLGEDGRHARKPLAPRNQPGLPRSISSISTDSDKTITPATFAQDNDVSKRLEFLSIFNTVEEDEDADGNGLLVNPNHFLEDADDEEVNIQIN